MVIDTSALIALLSMETEAARLAAALETDTIRLISAACVVETGLVIESRYGAAGGRELDVLIAKAELTIEPVTAQQAEVAREAWRRYGKGRHSAGLNFGDCFSYALARTTGESLLCKGTDFPQTDIALVQYWQAISPATLDRLRHNAYLHAFNGCGQPHKLLLLGCTHTRYVDGHHVRHWADGGETKLSNLVTLCRFHHRAVHEGRLVVERLDDGAWRFSKPGCESMIGVSLQHTRPFVDGASAGNGWRQLAITHRARGLEITASTATTGWRGEIMDYSLAIDTLMRRSQLAGTWPQPRKDVSAETFCG